MSNSAIAASIPAPNTPSPGSVGSSEPTSTALIVGRKSTPRIRTPKPIVEVKWSNENTNTVNKWDANIQYYEGLYDIYVNNESSFSENNGIIDSFLESINQLIREIGGFNSTQISILNKVQDYYIKIAEKVVEHENLQKDIMKKINMVTLILESSEPITTINLNFEITKKVNGKNNIVLNSKATHLSISSLLIEMKEKIKTLTSTQNAKEANRTKSNNERFKYAAQTTEINNTIQKYIQRLNVMIESFSNLKGYYESDLTKLNYGEGDIIGWKNLHTELNKITVQKLEEYYTQQHIVKIGEQLKDFAKSNKSLIEKVSILDDILNQIQALKDAFNQYKDYANSKKRNAFPVYKNSILINNNNETKRVKYLEKNQSQTNNFNKDFITLIESELDKLEKLTIETKQSFIQSAKNSSNQYITHFKSTLSEINETIKGCLSKATEQEKLNKLTKNKNDLLDLVRTFYKYGWTTFKNTGYRNNRENNASRTAINTLTGIRKTTNSATNALRNAATIRQGVNT